MSLGDQSDVRVVVYRSAVHVAVRLGRANAAADLGNDADSADFADQRDERPDL